jgi:hypothetical protein
MFSRGQIIFALIFFICFVVGIALAYRKDKDQNAQFFKDSYKVLIFAIFVFVALYGVVKLKHFF